MSSPYRARAIDATARGVPAEYVLRLARPAQYLEASKSTRDAYSSQAANDGLNVAKLLPRKSSNQARPAACWRREILPAGAESDKLPERAAGMLQGVVNVMGKAKPDCRTAGFGRRMLAPPFPERVPGRGE